MTTLNFYGENGFTSLIFEALVRHEGGIRMLLGNLKRFDEPRTLFAVDELIGDENAEIWLFPNFGKRYGFGEPDALVLVAGHAFWFEVETDVGLGPRLQAGAPLRQLFRFHCAASAFSAPVTTRGSGRGRKRSIVGVTLTNEDERRDAAIDVAEHLIGRLLPRLKGTTSHFVLFSVHRPQGESDGWQRTLVRRAPEHFDAWNQIMGFGPADAMPITRCWYTYWYKDLRKKFIAMGGPDPLKNYVEIKRV